MRLVWQRRMIRMNGYSKSTTEIAIAPGITLKPAAEFVVHPDEIGFNDPTPGDNTAFVVGAQVSINFNELFGLPAWVRAN